MSKAKDTTSEAKTAITKLRDDRGRELLPAGDGMAVLHPDHMNALPWIQRRRLTWEDFQANCVKEGLPSPTLAQWADTFVLTDAEIAEVDAVIFSTETAEIQELSQYFFIRKLGNKPRVCWRREDGLLGHMSVPDFKTAYRDKKINFKDDEGKPQSVPVAEVWLSDRRTRRYDRAEFLPGRRAWEVDADVYNLWGGWPAGLPRDRDLRPHRLGDDYEVDAWDGEDDPPEAALFLDHLFTNVCGENVEVYQYLLGWMSDGLVRPGRSECAVVMNGPPGSGKGTVADLYGSFFGPYHQEVNTRENVVGKFNRHLMECQLLFADEVEFSTRDQATKTLSNIITAKTLKVELKGVDNIQCKKWFRLMFASNDEHVIAALAMDRRFLMLNIDAGEHNQDRAYFGAMRKQWENGGQVAMFRWLTGRWWTDQLKSGAWDVGQRPVTEGLQAQKDLSLPPAQLVVHNMLMEGEPGCDFRADARTGTVFIPTLLLADTRRLEQRDLRSLGDALRAVAGEQARTVRVLLGSGHQQRQYRGQWLPPLELARQNWERFLGRRVDWPEGNPTWADYTETKEENDDMPF